MDKDMDVMRSQFKNNIQLLINEGKLENAKELIKEYKKIIIQDVDIYSMESVIEIMNGNLDNAAELLGEGLFIEGNNIDLLYNYAYIEELNGNIEEALKYYKFAYRLADENMKTTIKECIENLIYNYKLSLSLDDCIKKDIDDKKSKKILIVCNFYSPYLKGYMEKIKEEYNVIFEVITATEDDKRNIKNNDYYKYVKLGVINKIYLCQYLDEMNNMLSSMEKYDVIHIHYLQPHYAYIINTLRSKCEILVTTIWGSDFYRTSDEEKKFQKEVLYKSDVITFDNEVTIDEFIKYYGEDLRNRCTINRFGLTALQCIDKLDDLNKDDIKNALGIPKESIVIQCGYNAKLQHNHLYMIDSIVSVKDKLPKNMFYIFPMTYGKEENYMKQVKDKLQRSNLNYKVIEDFMQFEDIAKLTKSTDIMVHLQTTDTLSATMQEHLYNGNITITGSWLPYKPFKDIGTYFIDIPSVDKLGQTLLNVISNLEEEKNKSSINKEIIWAFSSWETTANQWVKVYEESIRKSYFNHKEYWNNRYTYKYDLETSGYMGLGEVYNRYLYKSRSDVLKCVTKNIYETLDGKNVLELGPGTGYFTEYFSGFKLKEYLGIDISDVATDNLKEKIKKFNFKVGDISKKESFDCKKYDLIFASDVLLHLTEKEKFECAINNIKNSLKDDGYYLAIEPVTFSNEFQDESEHNKFIRIKELEEALEVNDLELLDCIPVTFFMDYPFDFSIIKSLGEDALNAFNGILKFFTNNRGDKMVQENIAYQIYKLDKQYLLKHKKGLSNKLLVIAKSKNNRYKNINLEQVWDKDDAFNLDNNIDKVINEIIYSSLS